MINIKSNKQMIGKLVTKLIKLSLSRLISTFVDERNLTIRSIGVILRPGNFFQIYLRIIHELTNSFVLVQS